MLLRDSVVIKILLFRGHQVRKDKPEAEPETEPIATEEPEPAKEEPPEEVIDIDLNDPETEEAAVKIQASVLKCHI